MPIDFTVNTDIARPRDEVFAFLADPAHLHEWQPAVVEVEVAPPGRLAAGTRLREVRELRGRRVEQLVEVAELRAPEVLRLRVIEGALPVHGDITLEPAEAGTRVVVHAFGRARGAMRPLTPVLSLVLRREFAKQYETLRAVLEADPGGGAEPSSIAP